MVVKQRNNDYDEDGVYQPSRGTIWSTGQAENTIRKVIARITYTSIAFTTNTQGTEYVHELHEERRDVVAGPLAHSLGCGSTCPGSGFQWSGDNHGHTSHTRWNIHLDASIDKHNSGSASFQSHLLPREKDHALFTCIDRSSVLVKHCLCTDKY
jgi:hypothetical protein